VKEDQLKDIEIDCMKDKELYFRNLREEECSKI
jgi:hypothetical protein